MCHAALADSRNAMLFKAVRRVSHLGLAPRLVALAVLLTSLAGGAVAFSVISGARAALRDQILQTHLAMADLVAGQIAQYIANIQGDAIDFASRTEVRQAVRTDDFSALEPELTSWQAQHQRLIDGISIYSTDGVMLATGHANRAMVGVQAVSHDVIEGVARSGQPRLGQALRSRTTGHSIVPYHVPLRLENGDVAAVLSTAISLDSLSETLLSLQFGANSRIGVTENTSGLLLVSKDPSRILTSTTTGRNAASQRARDGERGTTDSVRSNGEATLAAFTPVPTLPWSVLIQEPAAEAFASIENMTRQALGWVGAAVLVAAALAAALGVSMVRPLRTLRATTERMARGDLGQRTGAQSGDEIGDLGHAFDRMAERLRDSVDHLTRQALSDGLTRLPNRVLLRQRLEQAIQADTPLALLVIDLDRFKEVNDTLGHSTGDLLLQQLGPRFGAELRESDTLARLGGDEFAVLLPDTDTHEAQSVSERLLRALERPFDLDGAGVEVGGSIGVAVYPDHGADADTLLRRADVAMYLAKETRSGVAVYAPDRDYHSPDRLALVADLRRAIDHDELVLYYQPKIDVRTGALVAVEALLRWPHPSRGLVPPDEFILLAEQTRLIRPLSRWVLRAALRQCAAWRADGLDLPVAVNLSAQDLQDPALPDLVAEQLTACGVSPEHLQLEITESGLLADPPRARERLARLRALGVRVAIDDFGTGYSSLSYLQRLPVDELKIDRSFVQGMAADESARAIVRAVIDLADDLGLRVVAEGVEDRATWDVLAALGCDVAQGYYFSPPLPAPDLVGWAASALHRQLAQSEPGRTDEALAERVRERGARLAAEEEFIARKRAEWALRIRDRALTASSTGVMITEATYPTFAVVYVNPAFCKLSGYTAEEVLGNTPGLLQGPGTDPDAVNTMLAALSAGQEHTVTLLNYRKDGSPFWNELALSPVRDEVGQITHWISVHTDATARVGAEEQRETLAQNEKLRALGQMASGVAHDLNQALTLIASHCELGHQALRRTSIDRDEVHELLTIASQAALDGGETVKRLLLFSRQPTAVESESLDLEAVVREVVDLTAPRWRDTTQAEGRPISLYVEASGRPAVSGSRSQLRDALINLVFNAVDALPSGGTIRMVVRGDGDQALLEVIDTGMGMTPEVRKRIFEPFFTTKGQHGTGLGLAMAFGVAEGLGGTIEVESAPGQGTTMRMRLPALASGQSTVARTEPPARLASDGRRLRILAVDDEPGITRSLIRLLRPFGHAVTAAASGEEALDQLAGESFDVVLSDLGLGAGMNGWELAEHVRNNWPEARFVLATGWGASIDRAEASDRGVDAVLAKPYRPEELFSVLGDGQAA